MAYEGVMALCGKHVQPPEPKVTTRSWQVRCACPSNLKLPHAVTQYFLEG